MDEEHAVRAGGLRLILARARAGQERLQGAGGGREVAARLQDRDLEVGRLEVGAVLGQERVRHLVRLGELPHVAQGAGLEVEAEAVARIGPEHRFCLLEGLGMALGPREDLAQGEVQAEALGLQLERLPVVQDGLVVLLRARVDVPQRLVGPRGRLQLDRLLEGGGRLVGVSLGQVLRSELDVALEAARAHLEEAAPGRDRLVVLLELGIDAVGEGQERARVVGIEAQRSLVLGGRLAQRGLAALPLGLRVVELGEHEVGLRAFRRRLHARLRLRQGLRGVAGLLQQARDVGPDLAGAGVEPLGLAVLRQGLVEFTGEPGLLGKAEVQVGGRVVRVVRPLGRCRARGGEQDEEEGQHRVVAPKRLILTRGARASQRSGRDHGEDAGGAHARPRPLPTARLRRRGRRGIRPGSTPSPA